MRKKRRTTIILILLILLLLIAVGYAAFSSNLKIGGTATADGSWDIHFENVTIESGETNNTAVLSEDKKTMTVAVNLTYPGEKETITVDVVNKGTINAYLTEFNIEAKDGTNKEISAEGGTYTTGVIKMTLESLTLGEELVAKEGIKPYRMVFEWMEDSTLDGTINDTATFTISFTYSQNPNGNGGETGDNNDDTVTTKPYLPSTDFHYVEGTSLADGLVIEDNIGNQYVWIEVPRTEEVYPTATLRIKDFTDEEYIKIENDLHTYTNTYRDGTDYKDDWSDYSEGATAIGFASNEEYNNLKKTMLKSVYQNGGFYIGRYEAGIEENRTSHSSISESLVPMSQANLYPLTYVTCGEAQQLASRAESGSYTSSLMFGVQWDLVLKYLETKGLSESELKTDSKNWGNYNNHLYNITNTLAKYSTDNGNTWTNAPYNKTKEMGILLTTGASEIFSKQGIYDLAGNVREWTIEYYNKDFPCDSRGVSYFDHSTYAVSYRSSYYTTDYRYYMRFPCYALLVELSYSQSKISNYKSSFYLT